MTGLRWLRLGGRGVGLGGVGFGVGGFSLGGIELAGARLGDDVGAVLVEGFDLAVGVDLVSARCCEGDIAFGHADGVGVLVGLAFRVEAASLCERDIGLAQDGAAGLEGGGIGFGLRQGHIGSGDYCQILVLDEWHHQFIERSELPSHTEAFQQLALAVVTGDPSHYRPTAPPNTHWRHWPEAAGFKRTPLASRTATPKAVPGFERRRDHQQKT